MNCQRTGPEFYQRFYDIVPSNVFICQLYGSIHSLFLKVPRATGRIQTGSRCDVAELKINCTVKLNVACMTYPVSLHVCTVWVRVQCRQIQIPKVGADRNEEIIPANRLTQTTCNDYTHLH